jgi:hypothetical protein
VGRTNKKWIAIGSYKAVVFSDSILIHNEIFDGGVFDHANNQYQRIW